ncbi:MAG: biopolymer transporter ExbD [Candidatus Cloacimonetes bacterium]|nr:biopolymer transporter ExbD [Candidatus Cloacimonadota bacterium]MBL7107753.1 biopolymer transporter ExbD [Candidatus Cloacimonadota bacterium]
MIRRTNVSVNRGRGGPFKRNPEKRKMKELNITSLIDILTILLVFMIKNVSMDATSRMIPQGMEMPTTITREKLVESGQAVVVKIYPNKILYGRENIMVGTLKEFVKDEEIRNTLVNYLKMEADQISKTVNSEGANNIPCLLIQADKTLDCKYISYFIRTSARVGFANIYFSTIHSENKEEVLNL